jgi:flagellar motor switch protein FliN
MALKSPQACVNQSERANLQGWADDKTSADPVQAETAITPRNPIEGMSESTRPSAAVNRPTTPSLEELPPYARSLLRIRVPVAVSLASKKETIGEILQLGPGAIVKFDKACDETLQLVVNNVPVAEGEAVKISDKFGLRISKILPPHERFHRVTRRQREMSKPE